MASEVEADQRRAAVQAAALAMARWARAQRDGGLPQPAQSGGVPASMAPPAASTTPDIEAPAAHTHPPLEAGRTSVSHTQTGDDRGERHIHLDHGDPAASDDATYGGDGVTGLDSVAGGLAQRALGLGAKGAAFAAGSWRVGLAAAILAIVALAGVTFGPTGVRIVRHTGAAAWRGVVGTSARKPPAEKPQAAAVAAPVRVRRVGRLDIDSTPQGAEVVVDGQRRGVTPLSLKDLSVGTHKITWTAAEGVVERSVTVAADKTTAITQEIFSGWVQVAAPFDVVVSEQGRALTLDDSHQVLLPAGPHTLVFEHREFGFTATRQVSIAPGAKVALALEAPPSTLTVTATSPAEVLVDGALVGGTPLTNFAVALGTREVVVRNASGTEQRYTLTVTTQPAVLAVDFGSR